MASGLVVHVEVGRERHSELLTQGRIRIGASEDSDLRLAQAAVPAARDLLLELERKGGNYQVADFDPTLDLTHNGSPLRTGATISDGDKVQLSANALTLRFFPVEAPNALVPERRNGGDVRVAPFIEQAALEAAATARRDDAKVFLREFTRELVSEINASTKILFFLFALALVGGTLYLGFAGFKELKQSRRRLEEQNAEIGRLNDQVRQSQTQFNQVTQSNNDIINSLSLAPTIRSKFGSGVCLISGVYIFVEQGTGRPLRYPESAAPDAAIDPAATDTQTTFLTPDGKGAIAEFPYVGTGFHVGGGYVLTNRHVGSEPWQADERSMVFGSSAAGKPKLSRLLAYFPGQTQAFALKLKQVSQRDDLAVCLIDATQMPTNIPTLLLDENTDAATVGKPVVLMGYPTGPDRILASLPDADAAAIKQRYGSSLDVLVSHLAERNLIKPLTTQGHVADVETRRIIYDARTAEGGSGAPLFGQSGRVIGINFAVFTEITDANFAVPIRFALPLLERAGWTSPQQPAAEAANPNAPNAPNSKETKTATAGNNQQH